MIRTILNLIIITFLVGCGTKSNSISNKENSQTRTDTNKIENVTYKSEIQQNKLPKSKNTDTLNFFLNQKTHIPPELYKSIFNQELTDIEKAYIREIKVPIDSMIPVIILFKTVESDREKEYVDLHIFNYNWTLLKSLSVDYEISWDLFKQEYRFLNDSIFEIYKYQGLSYQNDSNIKTTINIKLDKFKILDTLNIKIDTLIH
jgi:hypothetical protein